MIKVLCIDIEGGYGGSSRSLYNSICNLDRSEIEVRVICRRDGPIVSRYRDLGVDVQVMPMMPKVSSLPRFSRNLWAYGLGVLDWIHSRKFRKNLLQIIENIDVIHFNHEALWWLAAWLRKQCKKGLVMHLRTNPWNSWFARCQAKSIASVMDDLVFITENECDTWSRLAGTPLVGNVIYNIVGNTPFEGVPNVRCLNLNDDPRYSVISLSNYSYLRGVDQIIELAAEIKKRGGGNRIRFVFCGDMGMTKSEAKMLGISWSADVSLATYADKLNVSEMCVFMGHVTAPELALAKADALIKLTRESNPWGRDILEGLAAGLPVLTTGTYDRFVENGVTGVLQPQFDISDLAIQVLKLAADRKRSSALGMAGLSRVLSLCNGSQRSHDLLQVWRRVHTTVTQVVSRKL